LIAFNKSDSSYNIEIYDFPPHEPEKPPRFVIEMKGSELTKKWNIPVFVPVKV
jgi:hypothetical protein